MAIKIFARISDECAHQFNILKGHGGHKNNGALIEKLTDEAHKKLMRGLTKKSK